MSGASGSGEEKRALERAVALFEARHGGPPQEVTPLAGDASPRRRWRLLAADGRTAVAGHGPDPDENRAFLAFGATFAELGLPVPRILASDPEAGVWLEEDLGDTTLFCLLSDLREDGEDAPFPEAVVPLYRRALEWLPRFQVEGGRAVDFRLAYPRQAFDRQSIAWDLNYFKYHFLKLAHVPFHEARLERDFGRLTRLLLRAEREHFLYRDFQSRNIMVRGGEPWFIDFQGGRRGALHYDPASLLYDAKADLPPRLRASLLEHYLDALSEHVEVDRAAFGELYRGYVLVRTLQALGAYGYRGFYERKPHFLQSVPYAARNLARLLDEGLPVEAPELAAVLERIARRWAERDPREVAVAAGPEPPAEPVAAPASGSDAEGAAAREGPPLVVDVVSFSYRGGYPEDTRGHGGGFVFDCRALANPGRDPAFAELTGRDRPVVEWLEGTPDVEAFWTRLREMVDAQVRAYRARAFDSLTVALGCTGGQHRSVYLAERLARHLERAHPHVRARLRHRERARWPAEGADGADGEDG